ncbi:uracil phosphoribosyltransferase [candidate division KSB1 bacterium]|nr:uracil phosphoribosyltransferase [candidate division KSB1 bacterium]
MKNIHVIDHPFMQERLHLLRSKKTSTGQFRKAVIECGEMLSYEIARNYPTTLISVETPLEITESRILKMQVTIVAILRAALGLAEGLARYFPEARIGHMGLYRNEDTLKPVQYYCNLPSDIDDGHIILADPMLATGGSLVASLDELAEFTNMKTLSIATLIAAPEGIKKVSEKYPDIPIYTAAVDRELNAKGFILPGLGDAGDRQYGTF